MIQTYQNDVRYPEAFYSGQLFRLWSNDANGTSEKSKIGPIWTWHKIKYPRNIVLINYWCGCNWKKCTLTSIQIRVMFNKKSYRCSWLPWAMPTIISILAVIFLAENIIIHDFDRKSKQHEKSLRLVGGSFFFQIKTNFFISSIFISSFIRSKLLS